jgi:protocatechuate 3,4-dioxygenase beta subunit
VVSVVTDASGRFEATGLLTGDVRLHVQAADGTATSTTVTLGADGPAAPVVIEFGSATIAGRVIEASGTPSSGAWVQVERVDGPAQSAWGRIKASTTTGQDGRFRTTGLEPGRYQVRYHDSGHAPVLSPPFDLAEDATHDMGDLAIAQGASIAGRVTDDAGTPIEDATISLRDAAGRPVFLFSTATTGSDGRYRVPEVEPGRYTLRVEARGHAPFEKPVTLGADSVTLDATLGRGGTVRVQVVDAAGLPVSGARVTITDAEGKPLTRTLSLANLDGGDAGSTDARGIAELRDLAAGTYGVSAGKQGYASVEGPVSVRLMPGATIEARLELAAVQAPPPGE